MNQFTPRVYNDRVVPWEPVSRSNCANADRRISDHLWTPRGQWQNRSPRLVCPEPTAAMDVPSNASGSATTTSVLSSQRPDVQIEHSAAPQCSTPVFGGSPFAASHMLPEMRREASPGFFPGHSHHHTQPWLTIGQYVAEPTAEGKQREVFNGELQPGYPIGQCANDRMRGYTSGIASHGNQTPRRTGGSEVPLLSPHSPRAFSCVGQREAAQTRVAVRGRCRLDQSARLRRYPFWTTLNAQYWFLRAILAAWAGAWWRLPLILCRRSERAARWKAKLKVFTAWRRTLLADVVPSPLLPQSENNAMPGERLINFLSAEILPSSDGRGLVTPRSPEPYARMDSAEERGSIQAEWKMRDAESKAASAERRLLDANSAIRRLELECQEFEKQKNTVVSHRDSCAVFVAELQDELQARDAVFDKRERLLRDAFDETIAHRMSAMRRSEAATIDKLEESLAADRMCLERRDSNINWELEEVRRMSDSLAATRCDINSREAALSTEADQIQKVRVSLAAETDALEQRDHRVAREADEIRRAKDLLEADRADLQRRDTAVASEVEEVRRMMDSVLAKRSDLERSDVAIATEAGEVRHAMGLLAAERADLELRSSAVADEASEVQRLLFTERNGLEQSNATIAREAQEVRKMAETLVMERTAVERRDVATSHEAAEVRRMMEVVAKERASLDRCDEAVACEAEEVRRMLDSLAKERASLDNRDTTAAANEAAMRQALAGRFSQIIGKERGIRRTGRLALNEWRKAAKAESASKRLSRELLSCEAAVATEKEGSPHENGIRQFPRFIKPRGQSDHLLAPWKHVDETPHPVPTQPSHPSVLRQRQVGIQCDKIRDVLNQELYRAEYAERELLVRTSETSALNAALARAEEENCNLVEMWRNCNLAEMGRHSETRAQTNRQRAVVGVQPAPGSSPPVPGGSVGQLRKAELSGETNKRSPHSGLAGQLSELEGRLRVRTAELANVLREQSAHMHGRLVTDYACAAESQECLDEAISSRNHFVEEQLGLQTREIQTLKEQYQELAASNQGGCSVEKSEYEKLQAACHVIQDELSSEFEIAASLRAEAKELNLTFEKKQGKARENESVCTQELAVAEEAIAGQRQAENQCGIAIWALTRVKKRAECYLAEAIFVAWRLFRVESFSCRYSVELANACSNAEVRRAELADLVQQRCNESLAQLSERISRRVAIPEGTVGYLTTKPAATLSATSWPDAESTLTPSGTPRGLTPSQSASPGIGLRTDGGSPVFDFDVGDEDPGFSPKAFGIHLREGRKLPNEVASILRGQMHQLAAWARDATRLPKRMCFFAWKNGSTRTDGRDTLTFAIACCLMNHFSRKFGSKAVFLLWRSACQQKCQEVADCEDQEARTPTTPRFTLAMALREPVRLRRPDLPAPPFGLRPALLRKAMRRTDESLKLLGKIRLRRVIFYIWSNATLSTSV